jgi:hypothetical protein
MSILFETVESKLPLIADVLDDHSLTVSEPSNGICTILSKTVAIDIYIDDRGGEVLSTIEFADKSINEPKLYTHVVYRAFPEVIFADRPGNQQENIGSEINLIIDVLKLARSNRVSLRDLYFFQDGYNTAYTEYASGDWD